MSASMSMSATGGTWHARSPFRPSASSPVTGKHVMENPEVAQVFEEIADLLDIQGANPFRVRAYRNAARTIRDLSAPLAQLPPEKLEDLDGIGQDLAGKIRTLLETGDLPLRQELRAAVRPAL